MVHTPKVKAYWEPLDFCKLVRAVVLGYKSVYESVVVVFFMSVQELRDGQTAEEEILQ